LGEIPQQHEYKGRVFQSTLNRVFFIMPETDHRAGNGEFSAKQGKAGLKKIDNQALVRKNNKKFTRKTGRF